MRIRARTAVITLAIMTSGAALAQSGQTPTQPVDCSTYRGVAQSQCYSDNKRAAKAAQKSGGAVGVSQADVTLTNTTNAEGQTKINAGDFAGAAAVYQKGIDASASNPVRHILYNGLAIALRRQAIAAFNGGNRPTPPAPGAGNVVIRAYNEAVAASDAQRRAAAVPLLKRAIQAAATAAGIADAGTVKTADAAISLEMREDAALLYAIDRADVLAAARPSITIEADWLKRWLTATNPLAESLAAKYGVAVAANLVVKDAAAGLALADTVKARTGADADGAMGYAEIVVAAKTPAGDSHRAKALAGLAAIEANIIDSQQKARLGELKAALAATS